MSERIKGVMAAGLTAFNDDLSIDVQGTLDHSKWLLANGCDGVLLFGTTGEANSLSLKERLDFLDVLGESGLPMDRMMIGTGCCSLPETVELTKKTLEIGIESALMLPPFYYKNPSDDGLFAHFARVVEAVGDDRMKIYLYHFPQMSAVPFSHDLIGRFLKEFPGVFCGIKDSSGDFANMKAMAEAFDGFDVFAGTERYLLDTLKAGGVGTITATGNCTSSLCGAVYAAWKAGAPDMEGLQEQLTAQRLALQNYPAAAGLKELLARESGKASWRNVRAPFLPLPKEKADALAADMAKVNWQLPAMAA
ncbi:MULTISPECIES: dihydrodipicolinate synthase family protein [Thalassobaculum]|uniref:4-hydroxy-tetrahydrodipicolinate synthase n=1 Tax=Thalassobaculum litoreum DSM 18839 TaxID=1123362 RepID=A0A8G2EWH5_9PROT|nr:MULTISPECIES: dihydrodipicolinate synthase family protein [Thalassobaculum]SDG30643.1 4-hydroxy-tetrahydrodipicolinate synthase [Thalassobaculum litoreum DSM 18839]